MIGKHGPLAVWVGVLIFACSTFVAHGEVRGVSPYLPLNLSREIERQIERVLVLGGKPVMSRPIAAATVLDALPDACKVDRALCKRVESYLRGYMKSYGITSIRPEVAVTDGDSSVPIPNLHGQSVDSSWRVSASGYLQMGDYFLANLGGVGHDDNMTATGSFFSAGFDFAQIDIGFRDHWLSPLNDSSSLVSTEAPTMPSITLSNYKPLTPLGFSYQVFAARMSRQNGIRLTDTTTTSGYPRLAGLQLGMAPAPGYALAVNRITQYGGGARSTNEWSDFVDALTSSQNPTDAANGVEFGNQVASITSSFLMPGKVPFAVHFEYAGEDNAYAAGYRLGATSLSVGIDLPKLWNDFDATFEVSEWQPAWYVHHIYPDGLTNRHLVVGHWFGDEREFGNAIGGRSESLTVGWQRKSDQYWRARYRTMALDPRWDRYGTVPPYERYRSLGVSLATDWRGHLLEVELYGGQDIFGESFARLAASMDFASQGMLSAADFDDDATRSGGEVFIDAGGNDILVTKILAVGQPNPPDERSRSAHLGIGARRSVSKRGDLGVRFELDDVDGKRLLSLRALDYRYRVLPKIAISGFAGFARYDYGLPTNGYYWGAGLQLLDILPKWDVGIDYRHYEKLSRDKSLPTDPPPTPETHPRLYIDMHGTSFYITRRW